MKTYIEQLNGLIEAKGRKTSILTDCTLAVFPDDNNPELHISVNHRYQVEVKTIPKKLMVTLIARTPEDMIRKLDKMQWLNDTLKPHHFYHD